MAMRIAAMGTNVERSERERDQEALSETKSPKRPAYSVPRRYEKKKVLKTPKGLISRVCRGVTRVSARFFSSLPCLTHNCALTHSCVLWLMISPFLGRDVTRWQILTVF